LRGGKGGGATGEELVLREEEKDLGSGC
jgi:hypothetical protein